METAPNEQTGPMLGAVEMDENQGTALRDTTTGSTSLEVVPPTWLGRSPLQAFTVGAQWEDAPQALQLQMGFLRQTK